VLDGGIVKLAAAGKDPLEDPEVGRLYLGLDRRPRSAQQSTRAKNDNGRPHLLDGTSRAARSERDALTVE